MKLGVTNPEFEAFDPFTVDVEVEPPKRPVDAHRYATFNFSGDIDIPVQQYARVILTEGAKVHFRGYVYSMRKEKRRVSILCRGEEELLMHRYSPRHGWYGSGATTLELSTILLTHLLEDTPPSQVLDPYGVIHNTGALFLANSSIPPYKWPYADAANWIWYLPGAGTTSRIGTADIYIEGLLFPRQPTYAAMEALENSCYSSTTNLYVNLDPLTYTAAYFLHISAYNAFDTGIRRGTIDNADSTLPGNIQMNVDRWADFMINVVEWFHLTPHWRYTKNYTYFDALDEVA